jgi:FkbM family methyltransferase
LIRELRGITKFAGPLTCGRYLMQILVHVPTIAREKVLTVADDGMRGKPFRVQIFGTRFELAGQHFALAREMYGRQPYFLSPEFRIRPGDTVVDLGANEGLFTILAARLGARVLAVEALPLHVKNLRSLIREHSLSDQVFVVQSLLGPATGLLRNAPDLVSDCDLPSVPLPELLRRYDMQKIDFLKVDIEGSEFDLFAGDNQWLKTTAKIAMEVHPRYGSVSDLAGSLSSAGFQCCVLDSHLKEVDPSDQHLAVYIHAVRN